MINVYDSKETDFTKNGLVILSDCISCQVTEELNGAFECNIEYPLDERGKWTYLLEGNIIKADGQLFRIFKKTKTLTTININSRHIYYDLIDNFLEDVRPTALTGTGALDWILTHTQYAHSFTSSGDVASSNTHYYVRKNVIESIMGSEGIISIWGGEIVRDNYNISLLQQRGADRGVLVQYAKNIEGIEETLDIDGITTRIMPVGKDGLLLPEKYVDSPYINNFSHPKIRPIPFNDITIEADLRAAAIAYYTSSKCDIPESNHKVDFIELSKTDQYKNYAVLERVFLGDIITIRHARLGIDLQDKIIKTTKDILTNRLIKIESGSFKDNLATSINTTVQEIKQDIIQVKSDYQKAIENATNLITGSEGGNVVIRCDDITGKPYEILIMDTTDVMTCMKCWRWNLGGLGYSETGIEGPFETAITMDGSIVGKFISAISISASQIKTNELIVGTNIAMGPNAQISWDNVTSKPVIPTLPSYITSTKITATTIESPAISAGTIASSSISAGTITGASISAGTISGASITGGSIIGVSIRTSNTTNYIMLHDQYMDFYNSSVLMGSIGYKYDPNSGGYDTGLVNPNCSFTTYGDGYGFDLRSLGMNYFWGDCDFRGALKCATGDIATEAWVGSNFVYNWELANYATESWTYNNFIDYSNTLVFLPNGCYLECLSNRLIMHANSGSYLDIRDTGTWLYATDGTSKQL